MTRTTTSLFALAAATGGASAGTETAQFDAWELLSQIEIKETISENSYRADKSFPAELEDAASGFTVLGYAVPFAAPGEPVTAMMLVADMGDCPFCGSSEHQGSLEVQLAEPLTGIEEGVRIELAGTLELVRDTNTWQSAILRNARLVES